MRAYDVIVSLGGSCDAAVQLKLRNLRPQAMPFDWVGSKTPETRILEYLSGEAFLDDFAHAFSMADFEPLAFCGTDGGPDAGVMPYCYRNVHTGWWYIHHFDRPISENGVFEAFANQQRRRLSRMLRLLENAHSALFLFTTGWEFSEDYADRIHSAILHRYPGKSFDLRVMQFGATEDMNGPDRNGGGFFQYRRPRNWYDFEGTNYEWRFLDDIRLNGWPPRPHGFDKFVYKLWKPLDRYLRRHDFINHHGLI